MSGAQAQTGAPEGSAAALYDAGVSALEQGELQVAEGWFRRAFSSDPQATYGLALAATLQERGSFTEAIDLYDRLISGRLGTIEARQLEAVRSARDQAESARAEVRVTTENPTEVRVEIDGARVGNLAAGAVLTRRVDPGTHIVAGSVDGRRTQIEVTLARGEHRTLTLELPPEVRGSSVRAPNERGAEPSPDLLTVDEPAPVWPWFVAAGAALAIGAAVLIGVLVGTAEPQGEFVDGPFPAVTALR